MLSEIIEMVVEKINHINILILVRLNPLTDGNMGILANDIHHFA